MSYQLFHGAKVQKKRKTENGKRKTFFEKIKKYAKNFRLSSFVFRLFIIFVDEFFLICGYYGREQEKAVGNGCRR